MKNKIKIKWGKKLTKIVKEKGMEMEENKMREGRNWRKSKCK